MIAKRNERGFDQRVVVEGDNRRTVRVPSSNEPRGDSSGRSSRIAERWHSQIVLGEPQDDIDERSARSVEHRVGQPWLWLSQIAE